MAMEMEVAAVKAVKARPAAGQDCAVKQPATESKMQQAEERAKEILKQAEEPKQRTERMVQQALEVAMKGVEGGCKDDKAQTEMVQVIPVPCVVAANLAANTRWPALKGKDVVTNMLDHANYVCNSKENL